MCLCMYNVCERGGDRQFERIMMHVQRAGMRERGCVYARAFVIILSTLLPANSSGYDWSRVCIEKYMRFLPRSYLKMMPLGRIKWTDANSCNVSLFLADYKSKVFRNVAIENLFNCDYYSASYVNKEFEN